MSSPLAISSLSIFDFNDIDISVTQPQNPTIDQLWLDSSDTPNILKKWNGSAWVTVGVAPDDVTQYVASRGETLLTNGTGLLGNNTNFSGFTFDGSDSYFCKGSFKNSTSPASVTTDEIMPVDINKSYRLSLMAKTNPHVAGAHAYFGIAEYDSDNLPIIADHHMYITGTTTTLAQDLKPGDTVVYLTSTTNWLNSGTQVHQRKFIFWNYTNASGYTFPVNTYSRNISSNDLWADGSINTTNKTITLRSAWTGNTIISGTNVSQGNSGGNYKYIAASNVDIPSTWTAYTGTIGSVDNTGTNVQNRFANGTAGVKLLFLMNRDVQGGTTAISNLSFNIDLASQEYVSSLDSRLATAETKVTPSAITSTVTSSDTYKNDVGINKWLVKRYSVTTTAGTIPSYTHIEGKTPNQIIEADDTTYLYGSTMFGLNYDNYVGIASTNIYANNDFTVTVTMKHDDGAQVYINGASQYSSGYCVTTGNSATLTFLKGWNTVEFMWAEQTGSDSFGFGVTLYNNVNVKSMACYKDVSGVTEKRISSSEQKITPTAIVSTVRSSTDYQGDLDGKVNTDGAEIVSYIEQTAQSIMLSASKIGLNGTVSITSWTNPNDATKIDGSKIYTKSITSQSIDTDELSTTMLSSDYGYIQQLFSNYINAKTIVSDTGDFRTLNIGKLNGNSVFLQASSYEYSYDTKGNVLEDANGNGITLFGEYYRNDITGLIVFKDGATTIGYTPITKSDNIYTIVHPIVGTKTAATLEDLAIATGYGVFYDKNSNPFMLSATGTAQFKTTFNTPTISMNEQGISLNNGANRLVMLDREGIRISNDNGTTWVSKLTGEGLNVIDADIKNITADKIISGNLYLNNMTLYAKAGGTSTPVYDEYGRVVSDGDNRLQLNSQGLFLMSATSGSTARKIRFDKEGIWLSTDNGTTYNPVLTIKDGASHFGLVVGNADITDLSASKINAGQLNAANASIAGGDVLINGNGITINGATGKGLTVTTSTGKNIVLNKDGLHSDNFSINSDGTASFAGNVTATSGTLGTLTVTGTITIDQVAGKFQAGTVVLDKNGLSIASGGSINLNNNFVVDDQGRLTANNGTLKTLSITGAITIGTGGSIVAGGTTLSNAGVAITQGSINLGSGKFTVDNAGNVVATNATLTGTVNATGGYFGNATNGITVNSTGLEVKGTGVIKNTNVFMTSSSVDIKDDSSNIVLKLGKIDVSNTGIVGYTGATETFRLDQSGLLLSGTSKIKLGKIGATTEYYFAVDETGALTSSKGNIAGWDINSSSISKNNMTIDSAGLITAKNSSGYKVVTIGNDTNPSVNIYKGDSAGTKVMYLDATGLHASSGNFHINSDGSVSISGGITSTSGTIGGITINSTELTAGDVHLTKDSLIYFGTGTSDKKMMLGKYDTVNGYYGIKIAGTNAIEMNQNGISSTKFNLKTSDGSFTATDASMTNISVSNGSFSGDINLLGNLNMPNIVVGGNTITIKDDANNEAVKLGQFDVNSATFTGILINSGAINLGNNFSVDDQGNMIAFSGQIADVIISETGLDAGDVHISTQGGIQIFNGATPVISLGEIDAINHINGLAVNGPSHTLTMSDVGIEAKSGATSVFKIDGTGATFQGTINATAGYFGSATDGVFINGKALEILGSNGEIRIKNGTDYPVRLNQAGLTMTAGEINLGSGKFYASASGMNATAGTIAGWTINTSTLAKGNINLDATNNAIWIGSSYATAAISLKNDGSAKLGVVSVGTDGSISTTGNNFLIDASGNATFKGNVTSTAGTIGGWSIGASTLTSTGNIITLDNTNKIIKISDGTTTQVTIGNYTGTSYGIKAGNTTLDASGINAQQGTIAGWTVTSTQLKVGNITLDSSTSKITIGTNVSLNNDGSATIGKLSVLSDGTMYTGVSYASYSFKVDSTGKIWTNSADIGGWTVNSTSIAKGTAVVLDSANSKIVVSNGTNTITLNGVDGKLTANSVDLTGRITATSGQIGGWIVTNNSLSSGNILLNSSTNTISIGSNIALNNDGSATLGKFSIASNGSVSVGSNFTIATDGSVGINGSVTATSGKIANWNISGSTLQSATNTMTLDAANNSISIGNLSQIRYIRDWLNGNTANVDNHWVEVKVMQGATNIAAGKIPTGSVSITNAGYVTDGALVPTNYAQSASTGLQYIQLDLGSVQTVDYVQVWHYFGDTRSYHNTKTEVSVDGVTWIPIFDSAISGEYVETSNGRISYMPNTSNNASLSTAAGIIAKRGLIGGWNLSSGTITSANITLDSANNRISVINGSNSITLDGSNGKITANNVDLTGKITASSGAVGGWTIGASSITSASNIITLDNTNKKIIISDGSTTQVTLGNYTGSSYGLQAGSTILNANGITANQGTIGGWTLSSTSITDGNINIDSSNNAIWIGSSFATAAIALKADGSATLGKISIATDGSIASAGNKFTISAAGNASFDGTITSVAGSIGGWTLASSGLSAGNVQINSAGNIKLGATNQIVFDSATGINVGSGQFTVSLAGALVAQSATVTGTINATAGYFGNATNGVTVGSTGLSVAGTGTITLGKTIIKNDRITINNASDVLQVTLGYNGTSYGIFAGDASLTSSGLTINGSNSSISLGGGKFAVTSAGALTATSATIGGWTVDTSTINKTVSGNSLSIDSSNATMTVTKGTGGKVILGSFNSTFGLYAESAAGTDTYKTSMSFDNSGFAIKHNATNIFTVDNNGNASFSGTVNASAGSFTGTINASGGTFTGAVSVGAAGAVTIDGVNKKIVVNTNDVVIDTNGITINKGQVSLGTKLTISSDGTLTATSANITGAITATSGTFTGTINAQSGQFGNTNNVQIDSNGLLLGTGRIADTDDIYSQNIKIDSTGITANAGNIGSVTINNQGLKTQGISLNKDGIEVSGKESIKINDGTMVVRDEAGFGVVSVGVNTKQSGNSYGISIKPSETATKTYATLSVSTDSVTQDDVFNVTVQSSNVSKVKRVKIRLSPTATADPIAIIPEMEIASYNIATTRNCKSIDPTDAYNYTSGTVTSENTITTH